MKWFLDFRVAYREAEEASVNSTRVKEHCNRTQANLHTHQTCSDITAGKCIIGSLHTHKHKKQLKDHFNTSTNLHKVNIFHPLLDHRAVDMNRFAQTGAADI